MTRRLPPDSPVWSGSTIGRSCSWCHAMNVIGETACGLEMIRPCHCKACGHRADVPRCECDCKVCREGVKPLTKEQADELIRKFGNGAP
jgi:hypothetical protein